MDPPVVGLKHNRCFRSHVERRNCIGGVVAGTLAAGIAGPAAGTMPTGSATCWFARLGVAARLEGPDGGEHRWFDQLHRRRG